MITVTDFKKRLENICLSKGNFGLPKKYQDQQILFKSIILMMDNDKEYSELEINEAIKGWLEKVGMETDFDHVTLRRGLVDNNYLSRDDEGKVYKVIKDRDELFDSGVDDLDPVLIVNEAIIRKEEKKREFLEKSE
ncbi:MAG: DUF2087 domain-containing protein [bacterium]